YTIVFRGAGAENAMEPIEAVYDRSYTVTNAFVRTGYTINAEAAWKDAGGKTYADGAKVRNLTAEEGGTAVLTAQWKPNKYKVKFAPGTVAVGEVSGTMSTVAFTYGKKETLPAVAFKAKGYKLLYWESESGFTYLNQQKVKNLAPKGTITLTAVWAKIKYNINYELNGGKNPDEAADSFTVESDKTPLPSPTKKGYVFKGWFNNAAFKGSPIKAIPAHSSKNYTLYAKWTPITYTVVYSSNGGSGSMESYTKTVKYGENYTFEKNSFKAPKGYTFGGWICETNGKEYKPGDNRKNLTAENKATVIIKAKWDPKSESRDYHLCFKANGGTGHMDDMFLKATDKIPECGFTAPEDKVFNCWTVLVGEKAMPVAPGTELQQLINEAPGIKDFELTVEWKHKLTMLDDVVRRLYYPIQSDSLCNIFSLAGLMRRYQVNALHVFDLGELVTADDVFNANKSQIGIYDWEYMATWMGKRLSTENKTVTVFTGAPSDELKKVEGMKNFLKTHPEGVMCYFTGGELPHSLILYLDGDIIKTVDYDGYFSEKDENGNKIYVIGYMHDFPGEWFTEHFGYPNDPDAMLTTYLERVYYINH
ncbi:MAG: InlB B-repeat-containing protein, partial [Selenomonas sp.]|nr:InlB B-repeat-containing protein [Selenomonas sp.]